MPRGWGKYDGAMDGGVPVLPEHYVGRGTPTEWSFVDGVVEQLLAGGAGTIVYRRYSLSYYYYFDLLLVNKAAVMRCLA